MYKHSNIVFATICGVLLSAAPLMSQSMKPVRPADAWIERTPRNPALPTIFIVGDSTAEYHADSEHEGAAAAVQGWGMYLQAFFDPQLVNVVNAARSGRSSRTFITQGYWAKVREQLKARDLVLIQIGQNDVFPVNDSTRARGTLPGIGPETQEIENGVTHQHEVVHTYGWYLRQYVRQAKAQGAYPILMSLTPRNVWKGGHVEVGVSDYRQWARAVALQEGNTGFVDVGGIMAQELDKLGQQNASGLYHEMVHMRDAGSFLAAKYVVSGLKAMLDAPVSRYLSVLGHMVTPADELAFHWPRNAKLPTLWLLGDSTVRNGDGTGIAGMWGWGDEIGNYLDAEKINVTNAAVSGRSSRTYYAMDWPLVLPNIRRGDIVMLQFGHNDTGDPADPKRARGTLPGIGEEVKTIQNPITGNSEEVHTYGWYLRRMIADIRQAGAVPVVCSPVPRNYWIGTKVRREPPVEWAKELAREQSVAFVDLNTRIAAQYESLGKVRTTALFADSGTHTTLEGARLNAEAAIQELTKAEPKLLEGIVIGRNHSAAVR